MLKNSFYQVISLTHQSDTITASLQLDAGHAIFAGHFPGQPVVPGACLLQIVKEVLADALGHTYQLKKAAHLKFTAPIDPKMVNEMELRLTCKTIDTGLQVNATLNANGVTCFKMQGVWVV